MNTSISYRADIDGLRAVAVIAVILFHLDPAWLPGGYVGVDIFFVISGYLISLIIHREMENGTFSFAEFYARRMRRIVPALSVVILSTVLVLNFVFSPDDLIDLVNSAIYAQFFASNVYFAFVADTSYFSDDHNAQALLHLWSLAVEEQFYLFWPVLLFVCLASRLSRWLPIGLLGLSLLSFALGDVLYPLDPMVAYYMLPTRIGEFGIGALIALVQGRRALPDLLASRGVSSALVLSGAAMIAWSCLVLTPESVFPGVNALLPTGGAGLIILGGIAAPWPARLLAQPLLVGIGRISYSAYLWHWPIVVAIRYVEGEMDLVQKLLAFAATLILATITYHLIEQPFRRRRLGFTAATLRYAAAPGLVLILAYAGLKATDGHGVYALSPGFEERYELYLTGLNPNFKAAYVCQRSALSPQDVSDPHCVTGSPAKGEPEILIWGDSKAAHLAGLLGKFGERTGTSIRNFAHSACAPVMEDPARFSAVRYAKSCARSSAVAWPEVLKHKKVFMAANWASYLKHDEAAFEAALIETIEALKRRGIALALIGEVPTIPNYDRECYIIKLKVSFVDCKARARAPRDLISSINERIRAIAVRTGTPYFDFTDVLCDETTCSAEIGDRPIYFDPGHLSIDGSLQVGEAALKDRALSSGMIAFMR